jgi:hypothetical protein
MIEHRSPLIIDDRSSGSLLASNGASWRVVTDTVMGGKSMARLVTAVVDGRPCISLTGEVSLENNGGFVQASLDLSKSGALDATGYTGIEMEIFGNNEQYNLHLRTEDTQIVWQSYRMSFNAPSCWTTLWLPFDSFQSHRIDRPMNLSKLRRLGLVCIGRKVEANLSISRLCFR